MKLSTTHLQEAAASLSVQQKKGYFITLRILDFIFFICNGS